MGASEPEGTGSGAVDLGLESVDLIVVGSGFYGLTVAERAASAGFRVCVLERRNHLGGNAWSDADPTTGIEVHRYGSHIFHTSNLRVWEYVNRFTTFNNYQHRVWTIVNGQIYPMPITLATMSEFFGRALTPLDAKAILAQQVGARSCPDPSNFEEKAISLVGVPLYEAFIRGYTAKQWQTDPRLLPAEVITRLPLRFTYDTRYFNDVFEGIPTEGYGAWLKKVSLVPGIEVKLGIDWADVRDRAPRGVPVVYTGPIDRYFDYRAGALSWRTLDLSTEVVDVEDFQGTAVINYADHDVPYTRIHEFKHFESQKLRTLNKTVIMTEYSRWAQRTDEPYYPVDAPEDRARLQAYRELARKVENVHFGGRLGSYRYLDMHMAIGAALTSYDNDVLPLLRTRRKNRA